MRFSYGTNKKSDVISLIITIPLLGALVSATNPFFPIFCVKQVGMSPLAYGFLMTLTMVVGLILSTVIGNLSDHKFNRKYLIVLTLVSTVIAYFAYAYLRGFYSLLVVSCIFFGISFATFPQVFAHARHSISNVQFKLDRAFTMTALRTLYSVGWMLGPIAGALTVNNVKYSGLFIIEGTIYAVFSLIVVVFYTNHLNVRPAEVFVQKSSNLPVYVSICKNPSVTFILCSFVILGIASTMGTITIPLYFSSILHASNLQLTLGYSLSGAAEVPLMLGIGVLAGKIDKLMIIITGVLCNVIYFLILAEANSVLWAYAAQVINAVSVAVIMGYGISYFQDLMPDEPGMATTLYSNSSRFGATFGGVIAGGIAQWGGYRAVFDVCMWLAVVVLILSVTFFALKKLSSR